MNAIFQELKNLVENGSSCGQLSHAITIGCMHLTFAQYEANIRCIQIQHCHVNNLIHALFAIKTSEQLYYWLSCIFIVEIGRAMEKDI